MIAQILAGGRSLAMELRLKHTPAGWIALDPCALTCTVPVRSVARLRDSFLEGSAPARPTVTEGIRTLDVNLGKGRKFVSRCHAALQKPIISTKGVARTIQP